MHVHGSQRTRSVLALSLTLTAAYIIVLIVAGMRANSLALLSEAGHNASDFLALLLSWVAVYFQSRPPSATKTFGYHRAGVLAAFLNALSLVVVSGFVFYEAFERLRVPHAVQPRTMLIVASIGVVLNGGMAFLLHRTGRDVNIRAALIHQVGDMLSTAAVIVGALAIAATGQFWIDPALSIGIGVLILWSSVGILRETLNILLEGTPVGLHLGDIEAEIGAQAGVIDVHDLHVWSIGSEIHALSCHISIGDIPLSEGEGILRDVNQRLLEKFDIRHTTIQLEHILCEVAHGCVMPVQEQSAHRGHRH
jgi:cobalt-zinc-cadmium efflux system protein